MTFTSDDELNKAMIKKACIIFLMLKTSERAAPMEDYIEWMDKIFDYGDQFCFRMCLSFAIFDRVNLHAGSS